MGAVLLVVGCAAFAGLVRAGANVLSSVGLVLAVAGLVLLGNAVVVNRRERQASRSQDSGGTGRPVLALVLAVLLPPVGLLLAVTTRGSSRRAGDLEALAILVGTVLTVVLTLVAITTAGNARVDG
jgi:drug/metabolite transporter (DMT)-like permease